MDLFTHHAYLCVSEPVFTFDLEQFTVRRYDLPTLNIDTSRAIIDEASFRPEGGKIGKIFIIIFDKTTPEASEALLKVLEDPPVQTKFFLVNRASSSLPLTLLSRLMIWETESLASSGDLKSKVKKFLDSNSEDRLTQITNFFDCGEEALNELEILVNKKLKGSERAQALKLLIEARHFHQQPAMVPKLLWEHLALSLP